MAITFPVTLDVLQNPGSGDFLDTTAVFLDIQQSDQNDAIEQLEAKVGVNNSTVLTSMDFLAKYDGSDFSVYWTGAAAYARDNRSNSIRFSGSDFADVFNQASAALTAYGIPIPHGSSTNYYGFPKAPTLGAASAGGSVDVGQHFWAIAYVSATGESHVGFASPQTIAGANKTVGLTFPAAPAGSTGIKVYRTKVAAHPVLLDGVEPQIGDYYLVTPTPLSSAATSYSDTTLDTNLGASAIASTPSFSDGGSISIIRSSASTSSIIGAIPVTKSLQIYTGQHLMGLGRGTRLIATGTWRSLVATVNTDPSTTIDSNGRATVRVDESVTPPPLPFVARIGSEIFSVYGRTLVASNTYDWSTIRRWQDSDLAAHAASTNVYVYEQGRARIGAMVDALAADRCKIEGLAMDGNATALMCVIQRRNQNQTGGTTGGAVSTSFIQFNEATGALACQISIGRGKAQGHGSGDQAATANVWVQYNKIAGGATSVGFGMYLGDGFLKNNNIVGGMPPVMLTGATITVEGNHIANNNNSPSGCLCMGQSGESTSIRNNYFDNLNGLPGIFRPTGLSSNTGATSSIVDNYFNASGGGTWVVVDGMGNLLVASNHGALAPGYYIVDATNSTYTMVANSAGLVTPWSGSPNTVPGSLWNAAPDQYSGNSSAGVLFCSRRGKSATVISGDTIAHGMGRTPTSVIVTPLFNCTDPFVAVADITSTTFKVTFGPGGATGPFAWEAF